ncbi:MAG: hypothetical protein H6834_10095 [Planctomycetes bacterium]|nr:hypothetical protein [Planctomycetota bacterium]
MRTPISRLERIVGVFVLIVLVGFVSFLSLRAREKRADLRLHMRLAKTYGLAPGSVVKMNDLPIGRVVTVEFRVEPGREELPIVASLAVDAVHRPWIKRSTQAEISPSLIPGINTAEVFLSFQTEGEPVTEGAWLSVVPPAGLIEDYKTIPQELRAAIEPALQSVEEMSGYVRKITKDIAEERGLMGSLVSDATLRKEVLDLVARMDRILRGFEEAVPSIQGAARDAGALTTKLQTVVDQGSSTLVKVDGMLTEMQPQLARIGPMFDDVEVVLANARTASTDAAALLGRVSTTYDERIDPLFAHLTTLFDRVDRALAGLPDLLRRVDTLMVDAQRITEAVKSNVLIRGSLPEPEPLRTERGSLPRGGRRE